MACGPRNPGRPHVPFRTTGAHAIQAHKTILYARELLQRGQMNSHGNWISGLYPDMPCQGILWPNKYKSDLVYVTNVYECYNVMGGGIILKDWVRVAWKPRILLGEVGSMCSRFHSSNEASPGAAAGLRLPGLRCQLCHSLALWPCANHLTSPTLSSLIC